MYCPNPHCADLADTGVRGEYVDTIGVCQVCGTRLVPFDPDESGGCDAQAGEDDGPLLTVATFFTRHDGELAVSFLRAQGIAAVRVSDDLGGVNPGVGFGSGTRVLVPAARAAEAARLLDEAARARLSDE